MAKDSGIARAFYLFADSNAVIKRENDTLFHGPAAIQAYYANTPAGTTVSWSPDFVDIYLQMSAWLIHTEIMSGKYPAKTADLLNTKVYFIPYGKSRLMEAGNMYGIKHHMHQSVIFILNFSLCLQHGQKNCSQQKSPR